MENLQPIVIYIDRNNYEPIKDKLDQYDIDIIDRLDDSDSYVFGKLPETLVKLRTDVDEFQKLVKNLGDELKFYNGLNVSIDLVPYNNGDFLEYFLNMYGKMIIEQMEKDHNNYNRKDSYEYFYQELISASVDNKCSTSLIKMLFRRLNLKFMDCYFFFRELMGNNLDDYIDILNEMMITIKNSFPRFANVYTDFSRNLIDNNHCKTLEFLLEKIDKQHHSYLVCPEDLLYALFRGRMEIADIIRSYLKTKEVKRYKFTSHINHRLYTNIFPKESLEYFLKLLQNDELKLELDTVEYLIQYAIVHDNELLFDSLVIVFEEIYSDTVDFKASRYYNREFGSIYDRDGVISNEVTELIESRLIKYKERFTLITEGTRNKPDTKIDNWLLYIVFFIVLLIIVLFYLLKKVK